MYQLRDYQIEAAKSMVEAYQNKLSGGFVTAAVGSGKTLIIAETTRQLGVNTLIICNNQELVKQDIEKLENFVDPLEIGTFSASLNKKKIKRFTVGTIQSIYKHLDLFLKFNLIIIDECDLFVAKNKMFKNLVKLAEAHQMVIIGLTATPYRMVTEKSSDYKTRTTYITTKLRMLTKIKPWTTVIYSVGHGDLVRRGYLTPVKIVSSHEIVRLGLVRKTSTDYNLKDYQSKFEVYEDVALRTVKMLSEKYHGIIVFCAGIEQARRLSEQFNQPTLNLFDSNNLSAVIYSGMKQADRKQIVADFRAGKVKVLFNVNILTRGFDLASLDCAVMIRPTRSVSLYTQMVGRICRLSPNKTEGHLYDLSGTSRTFGKVEDIQTDGEHLIVNGLTGPKDLAETTMSFYERQF